MKNTKIVFTIADDRNKPYAKMLENSLRKYHDFEFRVYDEKFAAERGIDSQTFFYMATPLIAREIFKEGFEWVIKIDADSIVTGSLDNIFYDTFFDTGVVYNWNRIDPRTYGEIGLLTIQPQEYFNNGLVVMHNKDFVEDWYHACRTVHFQRMPMREQGFLNILCHYSGRYNIRCLDDSAYWYGLKSKGEWNKCIIDKNDLVLPKGKDNYPNENKIVKVIHWGGGEGGVKMNYKIYFQEECIKFLDWLVSDTKSTAYGRNNTTTKKT